MGLTKPSPEDFASQLQALFAPLVGQLAWHVRRGHGTMLTIEFGQPSLQVRDPVSTSQDTSEKVRQNLVRQRVSVVGEWHLWIQMAGWVIHTTHHHTTSRDDNSTEPCPAIDAFDGQRLVAVTVDQPPNACSLHFDLGGRLSLVPLADGIDGLDEWGLHRHDGLITRLTTRGRVVTGLGT